MIKHLYGTLLLLVIATQVTADLASGVVAYQRGDFQTAFRDFKALADAGTPRAQAIVGLMYSYGEGVGQDYAVAAKWYRRAADRGYSVAQYYLGSFYAEGKGVPADVDLAREWYSRAAAQGHGRAREQLALLDNRLSGTDLLERIGLANPTLPLPRNLTASRKTSLRDMEPLPDWVARDELSADEVIREFRSQTLALRATRGLGAAGTLSGAARATEADGVAAAEPGFLIQLGASRSQDLADLIWPQLFDTHADLLHGLEGRVERADLGAEKGIWYRFQVGPLPTLAAAESLCDRLKRRQAVGECFTVSP